eukprot:8189785-Pyramimonas_sp.AAC.1
MGDLGLGRAKPRAWTAEDDQVVRRSPSTVQGGHMGRRPKSSGHSGPVASRRAQIRPVPPRP